MMNAFSKTEKLEAMLSACTPAETGALREEAEKTRKSHVGDTVYLRGIIEFGNACEKDCFYCGIRKSNSKTERFMMTENEIVDCAKWAFAREYGSIVLQSGELTNSGFVSFVTGLVARIKRETAKADPKGKGLGITLCVGEQKKKVYEGFFKAGAHRYLLRIETSNPELYKKIHPEGHSFSERVRCLKSLREVGFQVGTGVMVGLPGQTIGDLANDLLFFKSIDADMIGLGPYAPHENTPFSSYRREWLEKKKTILQLSLNMIASARVLLKDVNIASTTAFDVLHPRGRELALEYGANVMMPSITPAEFRRKYLLYNCKPCVDEDAEKCRACHAARLNTIGRTIGWGEYGDAPHYFRRTRK
ncbi:[FeFe] hydrogenase H-cluster radical SAM maturase HydE [Candidatus Micrarchaeota archaeon]|nr:[FeFe] hydrogenase H-cluster radical SAM maturase HydE [Candidatus Micrarchaeota archaeon]